MKFPMASFLQELQGDGCTGFCICQGLVVLCQYISAALGYGGQTMIAEVSQLAACRLERAEERVVGVVHSVHPEYRFEAAFVERLVVCHERKPCDQRLHFGPHVRKDPCRLGVGSGQSVYACIVVIVIVRFGANQAVITVYDLATSYNDDAHAADARPLGIGRLEIYGSKVQHRLLLQGFVHRLDDLDDIAGEELHRDGKQNDTEELAQDVYTALAEETLQLVYETEHEVDHSHVDKDGNGNVGHRYTVGTQREDGGKGCCPCKERKYQRHDGGTAGRPVVLEYLHAEYHLHGHHEEDDSPCHAEGRDVHAEEVQHRLSDEEESEHHDAGESGGLAAMEGLASVLEAEYYRNSTDNIDCHE